jgi:acyl transferase domain-containing protein
MKNKESCKIAIIGLSCFYPGAKSPVELWENVLARKRQFRQMPDVRLPNSEYYDSDPSAPDKTYQKKAAVIDGYSFDWLGKRIPKKSYESTDIVHWLALDTSLQAVADAGYTKEQLPSEKMGVIIGNTLTGEFTRANYMRQRWPYIRKVLKKSLEQKGLLHHFDDLESTMEKYYKSVFSSMTEDSLAGGLANTIAGRICNFLDLHGGGYIVDGACSSSLLAICTAANALESGQMDMAIAGGVDISLDTFELIGFAKTGALTKDEMRVYDKNGAGFLPGEGCGAVIMKRLEDAEKDGDQIYAILNGWGISSDGKGGITAPSAIGQSRALRRAYDKVDFDTSKLDFIEGHGTGTTVGDKTELEGISLALNKEKTLPARNCGVTSFKSIVGHTKAAAGIGAFIKTVISLNRRILPPTAGLKDPNPIFADTAKSLYPILHGEIRKAEDILYAGVSAMGFGGINSHVLLQSGHAPFSKLKPSIEEKKLLVSNQESEIFF